MLIPDIVFVVGIGRSGTSLIQNMLNAHSKVCFLPENSFLRRYFASNLFERRMRGVGLRALADELADDDAFKRLGMSGDVLVDLMESNQDRSGDVFFAQVLREYSKEFRDCVVIGDKDPRLIEYLPMLKSSFPTAKVIHIYRDPRDVVLSKMKAEWSRDRAMIANLFAGRVQWSLAKSNGRELFGSRYCELAYENLIQQPNTEIAKICTFLEIGFESEMLSPAKGGRSLVANDELSWKKESLGPVLVGNAGKWRRGLSSAEVALTESVFRRMMSDADYRRSASRSALSLPRRVWISVQAVIVSVIEPFYCWYRVWMQKTSPR